ncbi:lysylphosphatidylglycerol synthase transmembrane domain-containing protein [Candidatus Absconditicoccus praedator]|uniref:lysylphosphatidylglycerol synthase transmembrane domain-containing protein n=1 Tax=Candidatus Absconditicoccus praedator TaxID=2735562 RepID=UPI001E479C0E|nr:lysylphosphatidylglycerol synthase transmembrane domain-containing protein [Candidatus Absconditicoccus praedator]UFX83180.1 flippase-like domain-containing protein [Candidatus Absconditicoccus praedator]
MKQKLIDFFKNYNTPIKIIITFLLFYIIFKYFIEFDKLLEVIKDINFFYILIATLLWPLGQLLSAWKRNDIMKEYGINLPFWKVFQLYRVGGFFSNFLPTTFGGDGYKFIYLNNIQKNKKSEIFSSMILERGLGFLGLIFFVVLFSAFFVHDIYQENFILFLMLIGLIFSVIGVFAFIFLNKNEINTNIENKIIQKFVKLINTIITFENKKVLFKGFLISLVFTLLSVVLTYLFFLAVGYDISFLLICFLYPIINMAGIIPISINSLGVKEGLGIYLYGLFSVPAEVALVQAFVGRIMQIIYTSVGGIIYIFMDKKSKS